MTKMKKICSWLDSNIRGGIQILNDGIWPCCGPSAPMFKDSNIDFNSISIEEIQKQRLMVYELMNKNEACVGCEQIIEKPETDIDIGKIAYLSVGLYATCNLRCKYCYFTHEQLGAKIAPKNKKLLPIVKKYADADMLKDTVEMGVAGGEPTLLEDLPETLNFLAQRYKSPSFVLLSNSSIESRTQKLARELKNVDKNIIKSLYTSIDAGTSKTYKEIRGKNLFKSVCKNILNYAKEGVFNNINLKYILLFEHENTSDKDIFGFLNFVLRVYLTQNGKTCVTIDYDMLSQKIFDKEMVAAAGKIYYVVTKILNCNVFYCGGGLTFSCKKGTDAIKKLEEYADNYKNMPKSLFEKYYLAKFKMFVFVKKLKHFLNILKIIYS